MGRIKDKKQDEIAVEQKEEVAPPSFPEIGGRTGPDPTRYGDYEAKGKCVDF